MSDEIPPYTCDPADPVVDGDVAFFDQDGNYLTAIVATECTANWFCLWLVHIDFFPGVTSLTWRNYREYLAEITPVDEPQEPAA